MKRFTLIAFLAVAICSSACKKESDSCWECNDINGNDLETQCGKSESEIKKLEEQNKWTCYKKQ